VSFRGLGFGMVEMGELLSRNQYLFDLLIGLSCVAFVFLVWSGFSFKASSCTGGSWTVGAVVVVMMSMVYTAYSVLPNGVSFFFYDKEVSTSSYSSLLSSLDNLPLENRLVVKAQAKAWLESRGNLTEVQYTILLKYVAAVYYQLDLADDLASRAEHIRSLTKPL